MSKYVIVARDYKGRTLVIEPVINGRREAAQRELDFIKPTLGNGTVEVAVHEVRPIGSVGR